MEKTEFRFSEDLRRLKSKLILFSGVSLFIGLTETLPKEFALIGLEFSGREEILGWFIFWATAAFLATFFVSSGLEIVGSSIPSITKWKRDGITSIYGNTMQDIYEQLEEDYPPDMEGQSHNDQLKDIQRQNDRIITGYETTLQGLQYWLDILLNCIGPITFSSVSLFYLYQHLMQL